MAMVSGTFMDMYEAYKKARTQAEDMQMGQRNMYGQLQQAMQDQVQMERQNILAQNNIGSLGQLGFGIAQGPNPYAQNLQPAVYPNKIFPLHPHIDKIAEEFGFTHDFATDGFKHPNGGFVARRHLEDSRYPLRESFHRAKTPNMTWLDDRVNEVRVKLC